MQACIPLSFSSPIQAVEQARGERYNAELDAKNSLVDMAHH